jgi:hypothetical protein
MANQNRLAGTVFLSADGVSYMLAGDFEYDPSLVERETLTGQDTVHGYSEKPVAPFIKGTLRDNGGLTVVSLNAMTGVTVVAELANGKTIIGAGMWTTARQAAKATDGTIDVEWNGLQGSVTEQLT